MPDSEIGRLPAQYVSDRLGEATIVVESGGTSSSTTLQSSQEGKGSSSRSTSRNDNWSQLARRLLKPEEVMSALHPREAITFTPGVPPISTWLVRYFEKDFTRSRRIGPFKAFLDAKCLLMCAVIVAVMFTVAFQSNTFAR